MEEVVRTKNQQLVELQVQTGRLTHESRMLEERNKFLLLHHPVSPTLSLSPSPNGKPLVSHDLVSSLMLATCSKCYSSHLSCMKCLLIYMDVKKASVQAVFFASVIFLY